MNTSFTETPSSARMERGEPLAKLHPEDIARFGLLDGELAALGNALGEVVLRVQAFEGLQRGTVVVESLWPNAAYPAGSASTRWSAPSPVGPPAERSITTRP